MVIENYELITGKLNVLGSWIYKEIVGIDYNIDIDYEDNYTTTLNILFFVSVIETGQRFKLLVRYHNVSDLNLRKVTNLYLTRGLIIHDNKELGWDITQRYHVHDDSGYGEDDGYNFIDFYCSSIEAISLDEF
ncbi:hypothetical protein M5W83_26665 [Paenibacillus thiaminolyticus]|uniref:Uncharacterized protein n=1 Tax=Paenibacillus thiaminolyticus TaxID=49283 RepID=A0AAP9J124_PANTH|nr:hypothetical protein [Paenibacillus thiaminolyticus]MCY9535531.1 hypothetical protein [Paenibacillus thiaminolyticus]MCY9601696.1 hypothetical protein [Paenibacillus thiaminolyticus]MCY9610734.1 hypothetical protein [Paenibacillus thiaminolyticus]MCY9615853.1 hypothetical protein [Paenibacillus thiaminolyticus]MCY9622143.1 hypothetical protein [Paenibacillus thiaminolyticus]